MIPREDFDRYARALGINADLLQAAVAQAIDECAGLYGEELYRALARTYAALVAKFGSFAAAAAVEFYAAMRSGAGPAQGYEPRQFDPGHGGLLASDVDEALRASAPAAALAARAVQRAMGYADATIQGNAMADPAHPRWALVPHAGACDWCRMIGSRLQELGDSRRRAPPELQVHTGRRLLRQPRARRLRPGGALRRVPREAPRMGVQAPGVPRPPQRRQGGRRIR